jgi:hypothetical protein
MITIKLEGVEAALRMFDPKVVRQAARAAIDRATKSGKTIVTKEITDVWNVKKRDVDERIKLYPPRMDDLKGIIEVGGKAMSLSYFGARQIMGATVRSRVGKEIKTGKITRGMLKSGPLPRGIVVQILKGKDTTLLRNAFLAKVSSGKSGSHVGVYHRLGKKRLPIEEKNVISLGSMINGKIGINSMVDKPEVMKRIVDRITERWMTEFPHQLEYYLEKARR